MAKNAVLADQTFDTFSFYLRHHMPSTEKNLPVLKGRKEILPCVQDDHWGETGALTDMPWQFGPGSSPELDSQYRTVEETPLSAIQELVTVSTDIEKSTDLEFEWQWIVDQQQAYKGEYFGSTKSKDSAVEDDLGDASDKNANKDGETVETESFKTSSLFSGQKTDVSSGMGVSKSLKPFGYPSSEWNAEKSPEKGVVWQTADSKELAALVSQRGHGYMENCDLPPSKSSHSWNAFASCNFAPAKATKSGDSSSSDKLFLESLKHEQVPIHSENRSLPSSHLICGFSSTLTQAYEHPSRASVPEPILSAPPQPSISKRFVKQTLGHSGRHTERHETLGEALCHSQTRARHAENFAARVLQEREKLSHLLFRESWTACTYKQWVKTLEWETSWLRRCSGSSMEFWRGNEFSDSWKAMQKPVRQKKMHPHSPKPWHDKHVWISESSSWLRCTLGLAFALGLSFAGAGLMLGWSMGWILLRY